MKTKLALILAKIAWKLAGPKLGDVWYELYKKAVASRDADKRDDVIELHRAP